MDFPSTRMVVPAVCGVMLTAGLWWTFSTVPSAGSAYVRVQTGAGVQVGQLPIRSLRQIQKPPVEMANSAPTTTALSAAPVVLTGSALGAAAPWLSVAAILVSIASLLANYVRRPNDVPALPVPAYNTYTPPVEVASEEPPAKIRAGQIDTVARQTKEEQASRKQLTPKQVVLELQRGNARFWSGTPERPELNAMERRALIIAQAPTVAILSCSDSRVPVEIVFDQGLGSVFVVRVAGNILDASATGSLEFAIKYLGVKVLLVMGHEACGAVKGAMTMSKEDLEAQPRYLQTVLENIKGNLNLPQLGSIRDGRAQEREAIVVNCSSQVKKLQQNPLIAERVADGSLLVCGAFYEITSGIVDFFSLDKNGLVVDI